MFIIKSDYRSTLFKLFIVLMIVPLFAQSDEKYNDLIRDVDALSADIDPYSSL